MKIFLATIAFSGFLNLVQSQELYPNTEPASNIPKGVLGIRLSNEWYKEITQIRTWQGYRFMFGLSKNFMLSQTFSFSNHHGKKLPDDFITTDGNIGLHTHGNKKGNYYPYLFETLNINLKWRFYSNDAEHKHLRMATWIEFAGGNEAHDEAEPSMMGDNAGVCSGIIITQLLHKIAISATVSGILPAPYREPFSNIEIKYGKAFSYTCSAGYLLLPFTYKNYEQTNLNLYIELIGKQYGAAQVKKNGETALLANAPTLVKGYYGEIRPGFQLIFKSNLRLDVTTSLLAYGKSYTRLHPVFYLNLQRYFYL